MSTYPIIFYPPALTLAWNQRPPIPPFQGLEPTPPTKPRAIYGWIVLLELGLSGLALGFLGYVGLAGGAIALIHSLLLRQQHLKRRRRFRQQMDRYYQELDNYRLKQAAHLRYCESLLDPDSIAEYQQLLALAALQTAVGYDLEIGCDLSSRGQRREAAEAFFQLYLDKYFPGKIVTKAALSHSGCQDIYVPEFAYIDRVTHLHINLEIDEPYISTTRRPIHCLGDQSDGDRNDFFLEKGWIVIRFSEAQVMTQPEACCKVIAREVFKLTAQSGLMNQFQGIGELLADPHWTWFEAQNMALRDYRLTYLRDVHVLGDEDEDEEFDSRELLRQASEVLLGSHGSPKGSSKESSTGSTKGSSTGSTKGNSTGSSTLVGG